MQESEYRQKIQETLVRIEKAFESVDPDVAECETQHGALTIRFADGSRCILSAQPSVRQLWMAVASKGIAFHFNWDAGASLWRDDKGKGIEALSFLKKLIHEAAGVELSF